LVAFHGEIRAALARLEGLMIAAKRGEVDRSTATFLVRFFDGPLLWHDEDEEVSLMRRLRHQTLSATQEALVDAAHRGHERMEALLDELLVELRQMASGAPVTEMAAFDRNGRSLCALLGGHMALEEVSLFPLVADLLSEEELDDMQREIEARHGRSSGSAVRAKRAVPLL
jgi:hemerythrin-like domain-containing protein